ncbi:MAG: ABC transporter substrate-binding protein [Opitutaceae bacterium]
MSKHRIGIALIIVSIVTAFVLARKNYQATRDAPGTVTIRVAHFTIDPSFRRFLDKAAAAYHERNPQVVVRQMDIPRQVYLQWQRTQIVGDMAPEIMQFAYFNAGVEDMVMHRFAVLDAWVEKPNPYRADDTVWKNTFLDGLGSRDAYSDKLRAYFGIPLIMGGYRFFYNEDLRRAQGLPPAPWNYQTFRGFAESGAVSPMVGSDYSSYSTFKALFASVTQPLLYSLDRDFDLELNGRDAGMAYLEGRWDYDTEEIRAAFRLIRDAGKLMNPGFEQLSRQDGVLQFVQERGLSIGGAHVDVTYLRELAPFAVGESGFPVPDAADPEYGRHVLGPITELQGSSTLTLGVLRSPLQDQAVDFLQFLTGDEMMALLREETGWRVSVDSSAQTEDLGLNPGYPDTQFDQMNNRGNIQAFRRNAHLIHGTKSSVEQFAARMNAESPAEWRDWLRGQAATLQRTLQQQESAILARWFLSVNAEDETAAIETLDGFLDVNSRQEAELHTIRRFLDAHAPN